MFAASEQQFNTAGYHAHCDQIGSLLTVIQSRKGYLFGGFSDLSLGSKGSTSSFIFSIDRSLAMPLKEGRVATLNEYDYGPIFGYENDIRIDGKTVSSNYHVLNSTYQRVEVEGVPNKEVLMGGPSDELADYQVFKITLHKQTE